MSTHAALKDRLAGLSLGADDFLCKPIDLRELLLRLRLLGVRHDAQDKDLNSSEGQTGPLKYETFLTRGRALLARSPASVAIVRLPAYHADVAWTTIREDVRRRDLVGWYDRSHLALLFPDVTAFDTRDRLHQLILRPPDNVGKGMHIGIACSPMPTWAIETLLAEADEA
jgi:PleD family two-component response regulator